MHRSGALAAHYLGLSCLLAALTFVGGCGSSESAGCVRGMTAACVCAGGAAGAQVCLDDGTFGACDCGGGTIDGGSSDASTPADGGGCTGGENACGGCETLSAMPGEACEEAGTAGIWACDGDDAVVCRTDGANACGGTSTLTEELGAACGTCMRGTWQCDGTEAARCAGAENGVNACGGCAPLAGMIGDECGECDGALACDGTNALRCVGGAPNLCGGCEVLADRPGAACGTTGIHACDGMDAVACVEGSRNACGGTSTLPNLPGASCGSCGDGAYVCASPELTVCVGASERNACGGCDALEGRPGTVCGTGGTWVCDGEEAVVCSDEPSNACGGTSTLPAAPGTPCNDCGTGLWICSGTESLTCTVDVDLDTDLDNCGSCGAACDPANAVASCTAGMCEIASCVGALGDCDEDVSTGCETPLGTVAHCGSCENACDLDHATPTCTDGACAIDSCDTGHQDCNGLPADGCEVDVTSDFANCGACRARCGPGERCVDSTCERGFQIVAGSGHSCYLDPSGSVRCWGSGSNGELGDGATSQRSIPMPVVGLSDATQISSTYQHTCALRATGQAVCWGHGAQGKLGHGISASSSVAVAVSGLTDAVFVDAGQDHSCAVRATGRVVCWGANDAGQLGDGTTTGSAVPVEVAGITDAVRVSAAGSRYYGWSCAVRSSGQVWCWGSNHNRQLGDGTTTDRLAPVRALGISDAVEVDGASSRQCALRASGAISCWGSWVTTPEVVGGISDAISLDVGSSHVCAGLADGSARCWGDNLSGQLGDGSRTSRSSPTAVRDIGGVLVVTAGGSHSCAVAASGDAWCWGDANVGQLGDAQLVANTDSRSYGQDRVIPFPVVDIAPITTEAGRCATADDEDGDGLTDCADPDCAVDLGTSLGSAIGIADTCLEGNYFMAPSSCSLGKGPEAVFRWRAPSSGSFRVDTVGSSYNTTLYVREAGCTGAGVACDPSSGTERAWVTITAIAGQEFVFFIEDTVYSHPECGAVLVSVTAI